MPDDRGSVRSSAPVDFDLLERMGRRLDSSARFDTVELRPPYAPNSLVTEYDLGYFPLGTDRAYLRIRWFENDDFSVHYTERHVDGERWQCRWDRHPSEHNARNHFHPPPSAETPGLDGSHPLDWRDVLAKVLHALDEHVEDFGGDCGPMG